MWRVHPRGNNWSVGATWKPSLRDSVSNRIFSKIKSNVNASLSHSHPLSVTHSPSHASLVHSLSLSLSRLRHTLWRWVAPRHPHSSLTLTALSLTLSTVSQSGGVKHRLHPSVSSVRYNFVIVWFLHVGLWFLFQSYGFLVLLCLILLYLYFTKKNVWPWCYYTIIIVIWKIDCTATRVHPPFWSIITKKKMLGKIV